MSRATTLPLLVSVLLAFGASRAAAEAVQTPRTEAEAFHALTEQARKALPRAGRQRRKLNDDGRSRLLELRTALRDLDESQLDDGDWIDLHLTLQAIDRRLTPRPARTGKKGEGVGRGLFEWKLRHDHQLALNADDLMILGQLAFDDTLKRLEEHAAQHGAASWQEMVEQARREGPSAPEELLPMVRTLSLEAWRFAEDSGFVTVPDVAVEIGLREGEKKGDKPFAWYQPGKLLDGFYQGTYMVAPIPLELAVEEKARILGDVNEHWMRVVSLHEAIPGHHLQFAIASKVESPLRSWGYTSVYVEGWGLYCEEAMGRLGFYEDPLTRLEQLRMRLWRAARVMIDVGLHCEGWSKERAVSLLADVVLMARDNAEREVERYLKMPTQPMGYMVGAIQIEQMHERARARAGDDWSERAFHDRLLELGPIPLDLAAAVILGERESYGRQPR